MTHRDTAPLGAPCWIDLYTSDAAAAKAFYAGVFGWTVEETSPEFGGYAIFQLDGNPVGGCMQHMGEGEPELWSIHLASDDVTRTVADAEAHGGQVTVPPMEVADNGHMAMITDNTGAGLGIWQPKEMQGFTVLEEPGAPCWFELQTTDHAASVAFYQDVFRWKTHAASDTDELRYTMLDLGDGKWAAGIMDASSSAPAGTASQWSVYLGTDDADATLVKVVELGGSVVDQAEDTPYGRLATAKDSTGATFKLVQDLE